MTKLNLSIEISNALAEKMAKLTAMDGETNQSVLAQIFDYKNKPDNLSDLDNSFWYYLKRFSEDSFAHVIAQDSWYSFLRDVLVEELEGMDEDEVMEFVQQQDWNSLVFRALETHNINGSYTCNSYKSKKILFDYWGDIEADDAETNAFENPEGFLVEVMILNSITLLNSSELDLDSEEFESLDEFLAYLKEAHL
jgi:hypothetical protein